MVGARTNLWHTIGTVKAPDAEIVRSLRTFTGWSEALPEADLRTDESLEELNGELEAAHELEQVGAESLTPTRTKDSPTRWRFRPPTSVTFRLSLAASPYGPRDGLRSSGAPWSAHRGI